MLLLYMNTRSFAKTMIVFSPYHFQDRSGLALYLLLTLSVAVWVGIIAL